MPPFRAVPERILQSLLFRISEASVAEYFIVPANADAELVCAGVAATLPKWRLELTSPGEIAATVVFIVDSAGEVYYIDTMPVEDALTLTATLVLKCLLLTALSEPFDGPVARKMLGLSSGE